MEQVSLWVSTVLAYWDYAFWWVVALALDNLVFTTIILLALLLVGMRVALKEYLLYKTAP